MIRLSIVLLTAVALLLLAAGCRKSANIASDGGQQMFSLTNSTMDGKPIQVLRSDFGLKVVPTRTDVHIKFGSNELLSVYFDPKTIKPTAIVLIRDNIATYDSNADGMPDMRRDLSNGITQVYYRCSWYDLREEGTNSIITFEGKPLRLFFNGTNYVPSAYQKMRAE
jgi:hypothetical protein